MGSQKGSQKRLKPHKYCDTIIVQLSKGLTAPFPAMTDFAKKPVVFVNTYSIVNQAAVP